MELREKKQDILSARAQEHGKILMKEQGLQFLSRQTSKLKEFDDNLVRKLIEQVIIHPDATMTVVFKSGTRFEV